RGVHDVTIHTLTMTHCEMGNDAALHALKKGLAFYAATEHYHFMFGKSGFREEAEQIKALWDEGKREEGAEAMSDEFVEAFSLAGDIDQWSDRLSYYAEEGIYPIIYPVPRRDNIFEDMKESIRLAADAWG
ncbi:MAG: LLM class flavin-dependent oxidoreductase, partial [Halobacteriales archaeon]|nr:LLM class flavin-dependent oxidoreductase [Halobacteriales archaeon]